MNSRRCLRSNAKHRVCVTDILLLRVKCRLPLGQEIMDEKYFPENIEKKWQQRWDESQAFEVNY